MMMTDDICSHGRPNHQDQIRELREAAGLFAGAMPITPKAAWDEAITEVKRLRAAVATVDAKARHLRLLRTRFTSAGSATPTGDDDG